MKPQLRKAAEGIPSPLCQQTWTETEWWPINRGTVCLLRDIWIQIYCIAIDEMSFEE